MWRDPTTLETRSGYAPSVFWNCAPLDDKEVSDVHVPSSDSGLSVPAKFEEAIGPPRLSVKLAALIAVPPGVVTLSGPLVAPAGTVARIAVAEVTVKVAALSLKATAVAPVKPVPLI